MMALLTLLLSELGVTAYKLQRVASRRGAWLKTTILAALTLSHVCKRWHKIVLGPPAMWQRVRISFRQLLGLGNISRDIIARSHAYSLHLDVSLLGCKWHSSRDVYKAARRLLDERDAESLRVEGPHWALYDFLKIFKRHNSKAKKSTGIKWLHIVEDLSDVEMFIPSKPFQLDLIAPHLTCLNAQFAGASQFPPDMDRIISEGHLFSRQIY